MVQCQDMVGRLTVCERFHALVDSTLMDRRHGHVKPQGNGVEVKQLVQVSHRNKQTVTLHASGMNLSPNSAALSEIDTVITVYNS